MVLQLNILSKKKTKKMGGSKTIRQQQQGTQIPIEDVSSKKKNRCTCGGFCAYCS